MTHKQLNELRNKRNKDQDEQYTRYEDIDAELRHYTRYLKGKKVYMPCDGPQSMFVKWFKDHPELGCRVINTWDDYRSPANIQKMKEQDIIITNPPFSLCVTDKDGYHGVKIPFIPLLLSLRKDFIIVCTELHVKSGGILPSYQDGRTRFGYNKITKFYLPNGKINNVGTGCWFTTLPVRTPAPVPTQTAKYHPLPISAYPRDMRTGAIVVPDVRMTPNTAEPMLVKTTALKYFRPSEYRIYPKSLTPRFANGEDGFQQILVQRKK